MILARLNKIPPKIVRLLARDKKGWHPLSLSEIAARSGIPRSTVAKIATLPSWENVPIGIAEKFASACGVNLLRPSVHMQVFRGQKLVHLRNGNAQQRAAFLKLMAVTTNGDGAQSA